MAVRTDVSTEILLVDDAYIYLKAVSANNFLSFAKEKANQRLSDFESEELTARGYDGSHGRSNIRKFGYIQRSMTPK